MYGLEYKKWVYGEFVGTVEKLNTLQVVPTTYFI